ncbi:MAG: hypothetical protein IJU16_02755 [Clostridia bacterium]|nr:hypothetical protein [Clostridia bacterium]
MTMKKAIAGLLALALLLMALPFGALAEVPEDAKLLDGATLVTLGDSITAMGVWPEAVATDLNMVLVNSGIGGDTTEDARNRFDRDVRAKDPDFVTIGLGTNDFVRPSSSPQVSLARYRENLEYFVDEIRGMDAVPLFITPPYVREGAYGGNYPDGLNAALDEYVAVMRAIAEEKNVLLVDIHSACDAYAVSDFLVSDGVHLSALGKQVYAEEIEKVLTANFRTDPTAPRVEQPAAPEVEDGYWTKSFVSFDPADWLILKQGTMTITNQDGVLKIANTNGLWPEAHYSPSLSDTIAVPVEGSVLNIDFTANCGTNVFFYFNGSTPTTHYDTNFVNMVSYFKQAIPALRVNSAGDIEPGQTVKCQIKLSSILSDDMIDENGNVLISGAKFYAVGTAGATLDIRELSVTRVDPSTLPAEPTYDDVVDLLPADASQVAQVSNGYVDYEWTATGGFRMARGQSSSIAWPSVMITENKTVGLAETPYLHLKMSPSNGAANGYLYYQVNGGSEQNIQLSQLFNGSVYDATSPLDMYIDFASAIGQPTATVTITRMSLSVYGNVGDAITWKAIAFAKEHEDVPPVAGDLDGSGTVNMADAMQLFRGVSGQVTLTDAELAVSDLNGDSVVNLIDALMLYRQVA